MMRIRLRIRSFLHNVSFQYQLFFIMCSTLLVIFIFNYGYFYSLIKNHFYKTAYDNLSVSTEQLASNISAKLDYLAGLSNTVYSDYQIMQVLTREYDDPAQTVDLYQYLDKYMYRTLAADPYINSMTFFVVNDKIPADMKYIKPFEALTDKALVQSVVQANGVIVYGPAREKEAAVGTAVTDANRHYVFSFLRLMNYFTYGANYGILSFEVDVRELTVLFDKEKKSKDIFIVDAGGNIIAGSKAGYTAKPLKTFLDINIGELKDSGMTRLAQGQRQKLAASHRLKNGWTVISVLPYDDLIRDANRSLLGMLMASLLMLVLALVGVFVISRFFSRKIKYLIHLIKNVESGRFDIQVRNMGDDELGKVIHAFGDMAGKVDHLMTEVYEKEIVRKSAELELLQAQINPHFLYNTLASIASLARYSHDDRLIGMVVSLSDLYRISLNKGKKIISVGEEVELTRNYTRIMMYRFDGLVRVEFRCDEQVAVCMTPKLILQPFVENSISHGIAGDEGIDIVISAKRMDNRLEFTVEDNGSGMSPEVLEKCLNGTVMARGYGIRNVQQRIAMIYGDEFGVHIDSAPGHGTTVTITLPAVESEQIG